MGALHERWGRFLCWIGRHDWYSFRFIYASWDECNRCCKRKGA